MELSFSQKWSEKRVNLFFVTTRALWITSCFSNESVFWCCWPCIPVTVGCSSLSPSVERVLNLDVTQGEGEAVSQRIGERKANCKQVCLFSEGDNFRDILFPQNISARSVALSSADTADENNPATHLAWIPSAVNSHLFYAIKRRWVL